MIHLHVSNTRIFSLLLSKYKILILVPFFFFFFFFVIVTVNTYMLYGIKLFDNIPNS